jgi:hypothetical protein
LRVRLHLKAPQYPSSPAGADECRLGVCLCLGGRLASSF